MMRRLKEHSLIMKRIFISLILIGLITACSNNKSLTTISSPNQQIQLSFYLTKEKQPAYVIQYKNKTAIDSSTMGFDLKDAAPLQSNFKITKVETQTIKENWVPFWGEDSIVNNHHTQMKVYLEETTKLKRKLNINFRIFDDGVGFRYEFPEQQYLKEVSITNENTEFQLTADHKVWWIPGDWDIYEYLYSTTTFSTINAFKDYKPGSHAGQTYIAENAVNTPVTMKTEDGIYLSFHEADLTDYAGMTLAIDTTNLSMKSALVGNANNNIKAIKTTPFNTPWRTIQIAERAGDLIESKLIVNLNDPSFITQMDYFKPTKYVGIWWDMHIGTGSWDYAGKHAATTEYAKKLIDFAAENQIHAILVEGWNTGWENWWDKENKTNPFDFVTPYPDYDLQQVVSYGKSKGVELIMHHETSADVTNYEEKIDTAFALMEHLGIHSVKTGYVGYLIPKGEYHHGQWMVNHFQRVLEKGIKSKVAINAHEPIKATGKRRTYPVAISREGLRGQEYNAWSDDGGNPPEHLTIVPFTRMLAGPIDYTPGIFELSIPQKPNNQINTTLAHQLALYVVIYSPIQMVPDLIQNYQGNPAFQFIKDVGVDWNQSKVLNAEIGEHLTIARQEKGTQNWFIGGITNEKERSIEIKLDFLDEKKTYWAKIYQDQPKSHYKTNPKAIGIEEKQLTKNSILKLYLAPGGGFAISLMPK